MIRSVARFACFALSALIMTGCAGKVRYPDYYMLALAPSKDPPANEGQRLPAVAVQRFETPGYLRQGRIVYRDSPEHIGFYDYHRWASDPGESITMAMIKSLRSAGIFSTVEAYDGQERALYLLRGRLEQLEEVDYKSGVQVEVTLSAQLLNTRTGAVVWASDTNKSARVDGRQMSSVVRAMGQAAQEGVEQLVQGMKTQLVRTTLAAGNSTTAHDYR